jgi:hypothetical protein
MPSLDMYQNSQSAFDYLAGKTNPDFNLGGVILEPDKETVKRVYLFSEMGHPEFFARVFFLNPIEMHSPEDVLALYERVRQDDYEYLSWCIQFGSMRYADWMFSEKGNKLALEDLLDETFKRFCKAMEKLESIDSAPIFEPGE